MEKLRNAIVDVISDESLKQEFTLKFGLQTIKAHMPLMAVAQLALTQDRRLHTAASMFGVPLNSVKLPSPITVNGKKLSDAHIEALINIAMHTAYHGDYTIAPTTKFIIRKRPINNSIGGELADNVPAFRDLCFRLSIDPCTIDFVEIDEHIARVVKECAAYALMQKAPDAVKQRIMRDDGEGPKDDETVKPFTEDEINSVK